MLERLLRTQSRAFVLVGLAMALAGIAAQAKMAALHAPDQLHGTRFRDDMASTLTRAMRGAEPAPGA